MINKKYAVSIKRNLENNAGPAREIEGLISNPGDSVFHYGLEWPETVEEYIELLRTVWADNMFVFAGGADPGGNLHLCEPLSLDTYSEPFSCPPMGFMIPSFTLWRDYYPLGALPGDEDYGDETIPGVDSGVKVDYIFFFEKPSTGTSEFLYAFCDYDCEIPQRKIPLSVIE